MAGFLPGLSARFLVLATLAGGVAVAGAGPRPFSHRAHLKLKLDCLGCHAPAAGSTRIEDNNLPDKAVCLGCHEQVSIKKPRETLLARFSHAGHLRLGNVAPMIALAIDRKTYLSPPGDARHHLDTADPCRACHRGLEESDEAGAAAFPRMADCLVCHSSIEPPFSCELCHRPDQPLRPASHTPDYLDRHGSGKAKLDKESCAVCHGRRFTCLGCH